MPELPEVETIRRQLAPLVEGRRLAGVSILDARWACESSPRALAAALRGRRVERLGRRGKYLVWALDDGRFLLQHLRMSGVLLYEPGHPPPHTRVRLELDGAAAGRSEASSTGRSLLVVSDPRRFGTAQLVADAGALERFFAARLGPEPFDERFSPEYLRARARGRRAPVKALLLDQGVAAGVGNIYADEALYRALIHPLRVSGALTLTQCRRLRDGVREALAEGIAARGASIEDFRHVDGVRGSFQDRFLVHRRAGRPCGRCGTTIIKLVVAGRGTYACERCQPRPRARRKVAAATERGGPAAGRAQGTGGAGGVHPRDRARARRDQAASRLSS